jgi:hypothetical protein
MVMSPVWHLFRIIHPISLDSAMLFQFSCETGRAKMFYFKPLAEGNRYPEVKKCR